MLLTEEGGLWMREPGGQGVLLAPPHGWCHMRAGLPVPVLAILEASPHSEQAPRQPGHPLPQDGQGSLSFSASGAHGGAP